MLRIVEEIVLLLLRDEDGRFINVPSWSIDYAIAGGVLMDLAMENRIDTDLENLVLVDATPLNDNLLDPTLMEVEASENNTTRYWVEHVAQNAFAIREEALSRLIAQGILKREEDRFLWVFSSRRYPMIDGSAELEVKSRIMGLLFSDDIPDPRDVTIICLAEACGLFGELLTKEELDKVSGRIEQVRKLDLIGQAMSRAIYDIEVSVAASVQAQIY